jgi:hypothetical protein
MLKEPRMRIMSAQAVCLLIALGLLTAAGCGGYEPAPPKTAGELSEQEKQQLKELDEQRAQEWGGAPKRK